MVTMNKQAKDKESLKELSQASSTLVSSRETRARRCFAKWATQASSPEVGRGREISAGTHPLVSELNETLCD